MRGLVLAALIAASPAAAQDRMTQDQCAQTFDAITGLTSVPFSGGVSELDADGWCDVTGLELEIDAQNGVYIDHLRWRASDIGRFLDDGLAPRSIEIEGKGIGSKPVTGDPVFDYLLGIQMYQPDMAFGLAARWDGLQNTVTLDTGYVDFNQTNRIKATALIDGVDLTDLASMQFSLGNVALRELTVTSEFDGWFETYLLLILGVALLDGGDETPQAQVEGIRRQALEFIVQVPDAIMPEPSRDALSAFITGLPTPRGTAQMQLSAQPGIGAMRTALILGEAPAAQALETLMQGVILLFTWTPTGEI